MTDETTADASPRSRAPARRAAGGPEDEGARLMLRFQDGDDEAFTELVRRFERRIVSLAFRYVSTSADAEDVAQEVFLRVFRAKERYEPTARFTTWLHRIAVNVSLNQLRARRTRRPFSAEMPLDESGERPLEFPSGEEAGPVEHFANRETADVIQAALGALPERQRTAILLNKYQGLSYEETAAVLGLSLPAAKSLLTRARVNLRDRLLPYWESGAAPDLD